ncbi:MAG: hypothetical protein LBD17_03520 [Endomicrobium sp.]|jgi:hypothetical protein|nr:hypothetical protein [Endomicrobium sp.]
MVLENIKRVVNQYLSNGIQVIFYEQFYSKNSSLLLDANISKEMLPATLKSLFPKLFFKKSYFSSINNSIDAFIESEILKIWGNNILLNYKHLEDRFIFIPITRIKKVITQNEDFIYNTNETFTHINKFEITKEECETINEIVIDECQYNGFMLKDDLPIEQIKQRNYELSTTGVQNAIFRVCLSDKFELSGKRIFIKGEKISIPTLMKEYCKNVDSCSRTDLLNYEKKIYGEVHRWLSLGAGDDYLVRINKETYVADKYVNFDIDAIDKVLESFIEDNYIPLKSFTTFGLFPPCGQTWNLFLLESFCHRFSKKFRFDKFGVNSQNAGVIIKKNHRLPYINLLADAVVKADIALDENIIEKYLFDTGYTARRKCEKISEIINLAADMLKLRN